LDSTILIAHLRGDERAHDLLLSRPREQVLVSVLSRTEIEGFMRSHERSAVARLFSTVTTKDVTDLIARRAGAWLRQHRASHPGIDLVDYLIAATASEHEAELVTLNVKHFPMLAGLTTPW
jgi:hypothetical protein